MVEQGKVFQKEGNKVFIRVTKPVACEKCGFCPEGKRGILELEEPGLEKGDQVEIEIPDKELVKISLIFYLIPSGAFVVGLMLGLVFFPEGWGSLGIGVIFLLLSSFVIRRYSRRKKTGLLVKKL
ncbi:MAG: SoxR reducing system RseC family protein [Candidatus Omnitrophota bacterium]